MDNLENASVNTKLRRHLIIWKYIKLIVTVFGLVVLFFLLSFIDNFIEPCIIVLVTVITEACVTTIFIIGGYEKNLMLLRLYYYFTLVIWLVNLVLYFVFCNLIIYDLAEIRFVNTIALFLDLIWSVVSNTMDIYVIHLLENEIKRLRSNGSVKNVNDSNETVRCAEQLSDEE